MFSVAAVIITITLKAYDRNLLHWSSTDQRPSEVQLEPLLRVSQGQNQGVGQVGLMVWRVWGRAFVQAHLDVGRI